LDSSPLGLDISIPIYLFFPGLVFFWGGVPGAKFNVRKGKEGDALLPAWILSEVNRGMG